MNNIDNLYNNELINGIALLINNFFRLHLYKNILKKKIDYRIIIKKSYSDLTIHLCDELKLNSNFEFLIENVISYERESYDKGSSSNTSKVFEDIINNKLNELGINQDTVSRLSLDYRFDYEKYYSSDLLTFSEFHKHYNRYPDDKFLNKVDYFIKGPVKVSFMQNRILNLIDTHLKWLENEKFIAILSDKAIYISDKLETVDNISDYFSNPILDLISAINNIDLRCNN